MDSIIKHYDNRFDLIIKHYDIRFDLVERSVVKAEALTEKRFESVNEFRAQSLDMQRSHERSMANLVRASEVQLMIRAIEKRIDGLAREIESNREALSQKSGENTGIRNAWAWAFGFAGFVTALMAIFWGFLGRK